MMYYWFMSEASIKINWDDIFRDSANPRPDISSPDEWIALAKAGEIKTLGCTVVIQNKLPKFGD